MTAAEEAAADLLEAERYIRDLERAVRDLEPAAHLTLLRNRPAESRIFCSHCAGSKLSWVVKRLTVDPDDDLAEPIPCVHCKGTGLPPQWVLDALEKYLARPLQ